MRSEKLVPIDAHMVMLHLEVAAVKEKGYNVRWHR